MKIQVNQADLKRLTSKLHNLQQFSEKEVKDIISHNANIVVNEMKREVPVDTGRLKRNIHASRDSRGVTIESEAISPDGRRIDYAPIIEEHGGRYSKGIHYFSKGFARLRKRIIKELGSGVRSILTSKTGSTRQRGKTRTFTPRQ